MLGLHWTWRPLQPVQGRLLPRFCVSHANAIACLKYRWLGSRTRTGSSGLACWGPAVSHDWVSIQSRCPHYNQLHLCLLRQAGGLGGKMQLHPKSEFVGQMLWWVFGDNCADFSRSCFGWVQVGLFYFVGEKVNFLWMSVSFTWDQSEHFQSFSGFTCAHIFVVTHWWA